MKTITIEQLANASWTIERIHDPGHVFDELDPEPVGVDEDGEWEMEPRYLSYANGLCLLRCVEYPEITYEIDWTAQGGERTMTAAYTFSVGVNEAGENVLDTGSIEIVDKDGDMVTPSEAVRQAGNDIENSLVWEHEVQKHLPQLDPEDIDIDEDSDMETTTLERDQGPDVRFTGEKVAHTSSRRINGPGSTRWTELKLYRTKGGKWVCQVVGMSQWEGEEIRYSVHIAESDEELKDKVGTGSLAKDLYYLAGVECVEDID